MGFPSPAKDYIEDRIDLNKLLISRPSATFLMAVKTDALLGDHIPPGSLAIIDRSLKAKCNDFVVAVVNGEMMLRRLICNETGNYLVASDNKFSPLKIEDGMDFEVWGVVSSIISNPNGLSHVGLS